MFVRAVWQRRGLVDIKQSVRENDVPTSPRDHGLLGLCGPDFKRMTLSLFDR
jgi:hypothetical protein